MLIIAPGQEVNYGKFSIFFNLNVCCMFLLDYPHRGNSNEYIQYIIFNSENDNQPKLS